MILQNIIIGIAMWVLRHWSYALDVTARATAGSDLWHDIQHMIIKIIVL